MSSSGESGSPGVSPSPGFLPGGRGFPLALAWGCASAAFLSRASAMPFAVLADSGFLSSDFAFEAGPAAFRTGFAFGGTGLAFAATFLTAAVLAEAAFAAMRFL